MIHLDMYQTIAAAVVALMLGKFKKTGKYSGTILHSCPGHRRRGICSADLCMLRHRNCRVFI